LHAVPGEVGVIGFGLVTVSENAIEANKRIRNIERGLHNLEETILFFFGYIIWNKNVGASDLETWVVTFNL
jgi:hypothetical protein